MLHRLIFGRSSDLRQKAFRIGALVALTLLFTAGPPAQASRTSASSRSDYCANRRAVSDARQGYVGIADPNVEGGSERFRDCSFGLMAAEHIGYFRGGLSWISVAYAPQKYSFAYFDQLVADLARHHLRFLPLLLGAPSWASTAPTSGAAPGFYPPSHPSQFAQFAAVCVQRYGPHGSFWRSNSNLPYYPVRAWEIWNEPNLPVYWEPGPDPAAYARLLRASYKAIKRVDRHAIVVTAGMPFASAQLETSFLSPMLRAGARGAFDALGLHPYAGSVSNAVRKLQVARTILKRFGQAHKPLWITEVSWAGGGPRAYVANQGGQARNLVAFFGRVHADRALRVQAVFWYGWQDKVYGPDPSYWGYHLGLLTTKLRPKLALEALGKIAARRDR
jgi:polysaccharide biosynthesis protein PslG